MRELHITKEEVQKYFNYSEGQLFRRFKVANCKNIEKPIGRLDDRGYIRCWHDSKKWRVHRLIWIWHNGEVPTGLVIDHINRVRTDNRIENLRVVTPSENARNTERFNVDREARKDQGCNIYISSGITKLPYSGRCYQSRICFKGKDIRRFHHTLEEAESDMEFLHLCREILKES